MTDRDRLIELFEAVEKDPAITCPHYKTDKTCDTCKYTINNFMCNHTERTVDYLLANGVIVQKQGEWKKTKEPLGWQDIDCVECSACHETWILDEDFDFEFCKEVWHYCPKCGAKMQKGGDNLINRQKAEVERLNDILDKKVVEFAYDKKQQIKSEAYKEFAERLLSCYEEFDEENEIITFSNLTKAVDDCLKELVGEDNA